jgi:hypothetical protein
MPERDKMGMFWSFLLMMYSMEFSADAVIKELCRFSRKGNALTT